MLKFCEKKISEFSVEQLYNLIIDIERYPEFLPWCIGARIIIRDISELKAELIISFKGVTERYTSQVHITPPKGNLAEVSTRAIKGPFKYLASDWKLEKTRKGTVIEFTIEFEFKTKILEKVLGLFFEKVAVRMVEAFEERAKELYEK